MHPILVSYGPLTIRWYGVLIMLGLLAGHHLFQKRAPRLGLDPTTASNLIALLFLCGILGARVYYILLEWEYFARNPGEIPRIDHGGVVFFGGFLGACLALWMWGRHRKLSFFTLADALAPSLAMAHAFGRVGCFMNACCYGSPCNHFWAVRFPPPPMLKGIPVFPEELAGIPRHPTQLYETYGLLSIFVALLILEWLRRYPGYVICSYGILYSMLRFFVEFFRGDVPHNLPGGLTLAQWICIGLFFASWIASAKLARRHFEARRREILDARSDSTPPRRDA